MARRSLHTGQTEQIPPSIVRRGFAMDYNALAERQVALDMSDAQVRFIQNYRRESWNPKAPPPSIRKLASKYGKSRGALYALRRSLIAKGYCVAEPRFAADGSCLASWLDFSPLWRKVAELDAHSIEPLPEDPAVSSAGPRVSPRPACPAACLPEDEHRPLTRGPATRISPEDSLRNHVDPVPTNLEKQFRGLAARYGPRFKLKPSDQLAFWRRLHEYAGDHAITRPQVENFLELAASERRYQNPDGLWDGLDHFRASRKAVAA